MRKIRDSRIQSTYLIPFHHLTVPSVHQVGCGGGKGKADASKSGTFLVLKSDNLALRHEAKVSRTQAINSPVLLEADDCACLVLLYDTKGACVVTRRCSSIILYVVELYI